MLCYFFVIAIRSFSFPSIIKCNYFQNLWPFGEEFLPTKRISVISSGIGWSPNYFINIEIWFNLNTLRSFQTMGVPVDKSCDLMGILKTIVNEFRNDRCPKISRKNQKQKHNGQIHKKKRRSIKYSHFWRHLMVGQIFNIFYSHGLLH